MERRRLVQVRVTAEAKAALERFCRTQGITMTALVEAIGQLVAGDVIDPAVVERARVIDAERRSRS